ncbi:MAG: FeoB-associated Cys-rich membrane protein [Deltaproteobacteria bacterium]|nr:FeoB-associated Cys-rich membrane protein [Deltaproteobacteria bacterium]
METVVFILIVAGAVWYLYRYIASALKGGGSQSCGCGNCGSCSVGCLSDSNRPVDAMTTLKDVDKRRNK